jgi:endogenous inhibitor of DNA gyrase (YacG/DUF329 family)
MTDQCAECGKPMEASTVFRSAHGRPFAFCSQGCRSAFVTRRAERAEELYSLVTDSNLGATGRPRPHRGATVRDKVTRLMAKWREEDSKRTVFGYVKEGAGAR